MIDNSILVQAYTTVLAGILIFVTLERYFMGKKIFNEKSDKLRKKREELIEKKLALQDRQDRLHGRYLERWNSADLPKRIQIKVMSFETERDYIHEEINRCRN